MSELWFWRATTAAALGGWFATAMLATPVPEPAPAPSAKVAPAPKPTPRARSMRSQRPMARMAPAIEAAAPPARLEELPEEEQERIREEALSEAEETLREAHEARMAERRQRFEQEMLDRMWQFVEDEGLSDAQAEALETAMLDMSQTMASLHRGGPPGANDSEPSDREARREARHAAMERLDTSVREILGDELAEAFHSEMRPPGPPGRR